MTTTDEFVGKVLGDTVGLTNTVLAWIGDELGLWKDLAAGGPATSSGLAGRTGLAERPVREWLHAMTAAGYLGHAKDTGAFALPAEHAPVLAQEGGPVFFGGVHEEFVGLVRPLDRIEYWAVTGQGGTVRLKDSRGLAMLAQRPAPDRRRNPADREAPWRARPALLTRRADGDVFELSAGARSAVDRHAESARVELLGTGHVESWHPASVRDETCAVGRARRARCAGDEPG